MKMKKNNLKKKWTIYVEIQNRENLNVTRIQPLECYLLLCENHEFVYVVVLPPNVVLALKASLWRALSSILVTFLTETDHFSGKNEALIKVEPFEGKQKHNIKKAYFSFVCFFFGFFAQLRSDGNRERNETDLWYNMSWGCKWRVWLDKQIIPNFFVL